MFFSPSMDLIRLGRPKFKRFERDASGRTKRIHAYVTFGSNCNSNCGFCRNQLFSDEMMMDNYEKVCKTLSKYSPYIHTMVFGGGEPLLYADKLYAAITNSRIVDYDTQTYIITNGFRTPFLREIADCRLCRHLNGIMLSRHHYDDNKNAEVFGNSRLVTTQDLRKELCYTLRGKMEFVTTCLKGYIDSPKEIIKFIEWGKKLEIQKFLFNNLQKDVTVSDFFVNNQIDSNVFDECEKLLLKKGYELDISVCYTAGYDITTYTKGDIRVGFKRYHQSRKETIKKWKESKRYTYDLSVMPNGDIFSDWTNTHKL